MLSSSLHAQEKHKITPLTTLTTKEQSMKIVTSDDKVAAFIMTKYEDSLSTHTIVYKEDRQGRYKEHSFKLPIVLMPVIVRYCQSLNKK